MAASPVAVRPAREADAAVIVGLIRRLAAFEEPGASVALTEETVRTDCFGPAPRFSVLLAEADGAVLGGAVLLDVYSSWAGKPAMIVHDLFVEDDARGHGVGRALLSAAARRAARRGCCRLDVNVVSWNRRARDFYESQGFREVAGWRPYRLDAEGLQRLAREETTPD